MEEPDNNLWTSDSMKRKGVRIVKVNILSQSPTQICMVFNDTVPSYYQGSITTLQEPTLVIFLIPICFTLYLKVSLDLITD